MNHDDEDHDRGLALDLPTLLSRRRLLGLVGLAGAAALAGCSDEDQPEATGGGEIPAETGGGEIPAETGGPFPADGSNGVNVLTESGIVRRDLTRSFGTSSSVAPGVPLTVAMTIVDASADLAPLPGAAIYVWHCTREGDYSLYSPGVAQENYLRGVQVADASGAVSFTSIYPGAYSGRWPHIHFEVYPNVEAATTASGKLRTSQIALPEEASRQVYATPGYAESLRNLEQTSLATDMVFRDGWSLQLGTVTGDMTGGLTVTLAVPV